MWHSGGSKSSKKQTSGSASNAVTTANVDRDDISEGSLEDDRDDNLEEGNTGVKQVRETERRYANNARERCVTSMRCINLWRNRETRKLFWTCKKVLTSLFTSC